MTFKRMVLEEWFDQYQYEVDYDIGESGIKYFKFQDLNIDLDDVDLRYTHHLGSPELRATIALEYEGLNWKNIGVTTGAAESIFTLIASLTSRSDHLIVECPNYPSFRYISNSLERNMDLLFLKYEEEFKPNIKTLESMIRPNTKLICLTHPNNPTGSTITKQILRNLIDIVEKHEIYLLLDETYRDLSFQEPPPLAASMSNKAISVSTMSKAFGVPGIRTGWVASQDDSVICGVLKVREQTTICNSAINEIIALNILKKKSEYLTKIMKRVKTNFNLLEEWMARQDELEWITPKGGVTCFPRFGTSSENLCRLLVNKYRTFTVPGYCFNMDYHFRIGFGGDTYELAKGLENLEIAMGEIGHKD
ncbi:MAG: aminotransferase class I/II-fold pyridoxal phosphate-dependent enzyme [Candidatus Hodarchaeota archaeon]